MAGGAVVLDRIMSRRITQRDRLLVGIGAGSNGSNCREQGECHA
jgi:hypothetical protein